MATKTLGPPRFSGSIEAQFRGLMMWLFQFHKASENRNDDVDARFSQIEAVISKIADIAPLTQAISNPPSQAEVAAIQAKLNEVILAAREITA